MSERALEKETSVNNGARISELEAALEHKERLIQELRETLASQTRKAQLCRALYGQFHATLQSEMKALIGENQGLKRLHKALVSSTSWRMTAPLRALMTAIKGLRRHASTPGPVAAEAATRSMANYGLWVQAHGALRTANRQAIAKHISALALRPKISILMPVCDPEERWLRAAIESVRGQLYPDWELCIADDASTHPQIRRVLEDYQDRDDRIKGVFREHRGHIAAASNSALAIASGDFVALLDHDDELTPDALYEVARVINEQRPDVIYSDEDMVTDHDRYARGYFKPDFSPDLLLSHNYITHLLVVNRELLGAVGGFREDYAGAQDYDLVLRLTERAAGICHIRKVLYHWRQHRDSTSTGGDAKPYSVAAGKAALVDAMARRGIAGRVEDGNMANFFGIRRTLWEHPLVSIIIPFRDKADLLRICLEALLAKTTYSNFEILGISNGSEETATRTAMAELERRDARVKFYDYDIPFNFSRINNYAAELARGTHLILLNNDIEIITPDWIEALLEHSQRSEVGAVGGKLYYADDTVQHAGVIVGIAGFAGHSHRHIARDARGYFNRPCIVQNVSAVTGAMLMVKRALYRQVGGMDEEHLGTSLNDVDFCLRLQERGCLNVFTPYAEAYHYESLSRGYEITPEKQARFQQEIAYFQQRHWQILAAGDPFYNPNLDLKHEDFRFGGKPSSSAKTFGMYRQEPRRAAASGGEAHA